MKTSCIRYMLLSAALVCVMSYSVNPVLAQGENRLQAAASGSQTYATEGILSQRVNYIDPEDGTIFYSVERTDTSQLWVIVERSPDGTLSRWQEGYEGMYHSGSNQMPIVHFNPSVVGVKDYWSNTFYYNPKDDKVHQGLLFTNSPNGSWGFTMMNTYRYDQSSSQYQLVKNYLIKNTSTGEIEEWMSNSHSSTLYWMPDNKLLIERYSYSEKQNEIVIYDPSLHKWTKHMNASLIAYNPDLNQMIFTYNESNRVEHVYDFKTKQIHLAADAKHLDPIRYHAEDVLESALPKLDANLDLSALPVKSIAMIRDLSHVVHMNGQDIEVPYTIKKDGTLWIPIKPLMDTFGWKVERLHESNKGYRYSIEANNARIELRSDNSLMLKENLFITRGQLQSLGYSHVTVTANLQDSE